MTTFNAFTNHFILPANVGNLVIVRLVVLTGIIKPSGAFMV